MAASLVQDPNSYVLTAADRCDRCGAQAYVSVAHENWRQDLLFCCHHARCHVPALEQIEGVWIHDESERLYETVTAQKANA